MNLLDRPATQPLPHALGTELVAVAPAPVAEVITAALALEHGFGIAAVLTDQRQPRDDLCEVLAAGGGRICAHDAALPQPAHTRLIAAHCWGVTVRSQRALIRL